MSAKPVLFSDIEQIFSSVLPYKKQIIIAVGVFLIAASSFGYYRYYRGSVESKAHKEFVEAMKYFNAPIGQKELDVLDLDAPESFASYEEKWRKVSEVFLRGYEKNSSSSIASMFLAHHSEALTRLDKHDEALAMLKKAIPQIKSEEIKAIYQIKLALMQLDSKKKEEQEVGMALLDKLSRIASFATDQALYHIGDYHFSKGNFLEARDFWNRLILQFGLDSKFPSRFASLATEKLQLINGFDAYQKSSALKKSTGQV